MAHLAGILCSGGVGVRPHCTKIATQVVPVYGGADPVCDDHAWGSGRGRLEGPIVIAWESEGDEIAVEDYAP